MGDAPVSEMEWNEPFFRDCFDNVAKVVETMFRDCFDNVAKVGGGRLLPWDIEMTVEEPVSDDNDGPPHSGRGVDLPSFI